MLVVEPIYITLATGVPYLNAYHFLGQTPTKTTNQQVAIGSDIQPLASWLVQCGCAYSGHILKSIFITDMIG